MATLIGRAAGDAFKDLVRLLLIILSFVFLLPEGGAASGEAGPRIDGTSTGSVDIRVQRD